MKTIRGAVVALSAVMAATLIGAALAPRAKADQWDRKTIVTFGEAVEISGQVLPAGTYVFRLADTISDRHIVQIWNPGEDQLLATLATIPNKRFEPPDQTIFEFDERPSGSPMAIKVWYYPGNTTGEEFVYSHYSLRAAHSYNQ